MYIYKIMKNKILKIILYFSPLEKLIPERNSFT